VCGHGQIYNYSVCKAKKMSFGMRNRPCARMCDTYIYTCARICFVSYNVAPNIAQVYPLVFVCVCVCVCARLFSLYSLAAVILVFAAREGAAKGVFFH